MGTTVDLKCASLKAVAYCRHELQFCSGTCNNVEMYCYCAIGTSLSWRFAEGSLAPSPAPLCHCTAADAAATHPSIQHEELWGWHFSLQLQPITTCHGSAIALISVGCEAQQQEMWFITPFLPWFALAVGESSAHSWGQDHFQLLLLRQGDDCMGSLRASHENLSFCYFSVDKLRFGAVKK